MSITTEWFSTPLGSVEISCDDIGGRHISGRREALELAIGYYTNALCPQAQQEVKTHHRKTVGRLLGDWKTKQGHAGGDHRRRCDEVVRALEAAIVALSS